MNPALKWDDRPAAGPAELNEKMKTIVGDLGDGATVVLRTGVPLVSGANKIRHNLPAGRAPRAVAFVPYSNVGWWVPTRPDGQFVYIDTAGAVTGDLHLWI